jgi:hypothetical protein
LIAFSGVMVVLWFLAAHAAGDRSCCMGVVKVVVVDAFIFPSEPDFVQQSLSTKSNFDVLMTVPLLRVNPSG